MYLNRIPILLPYFMPKGKWTMPSGSGAGSVYLTFDDGPHPIATPFVLDELQKHNAKATFFCVGKNVQEYPNIMDRIISEGHLIGNHTHNHLNGWRSDTHVYLEDVRQAAKYISSSLFRPPYGRIKKAQARELDQGGFELIYWSLLSGDFDENLSPSSCLRQVTKKLKPGDIVVFHDSPKAWARLQYVLPHILALCKQQNWTVETL
jgi:peptidoglycan/xylan/chitin deacetylase (PgdA/CDA1 family)